MGLVGISNILLAISSILLLPILTKNLPVSEFGAWAQILVTLNLVSAIFTLGFPHALMRFLPSVNHKKNIREDFYASFLVVMLSSLFIAIVFFIFSKSISNIFFHNVYYSSILIISLVIFVFNLNSFVINYYRASQQIKKYSLFLVMKVYLFIILLFYFAFNGMTLTEVLIIYLVAQILTFLTSILIIVNQIGFGVPKFKNLRRYLSFGLPLLPGYLAYWIVESSDRYVIGLLMGSIFVGFYSPGYTVANLIVMISMPFPAMLLPVISKYYDEGNIKKVKTYLNYSLKLFLVLAMPSAFGISIMSLALLNILTTPEIASKGYLVTPFVAVGGMFYGIYNILSLIFALKLKTYVTSIVFSLAAVFNLTFTILLIYYIGILGAAIASMMTYILIFVLAKHFMDKYIKINLDFKFVLKTLFASIIMSLFILFINPAEILMILITIVISAIIYFTVLFLLKTFNSEEINLIKSILKLS